jgi:hypothetical protein
MIKIICNLLILILLLLPSHASSEEIAVDLELVMAVDASGSVDAEEYALQMQGIAAAFRDPEVLAAIRSGPLGRIAASVVIWSESTRDKEALPWRILSDGAEAEAFARQVETTPRRITVGGTGIGMALLIQNNGIAGKRRVIDLSGDGQETPPRDYTIDLQQGRYIAQAAGVTVNGLAILAEEPELDRYYRRKLITGPGAFVMATGDYRDFAAAMRRKLIREIEYRPVISQR